MNSVALNKCVSWEHKKEIEIKIHVPTGHFEPEDGPCDPPTGDTRYPHGQVN